MAYTWCDDSDAIWEWVGGLTPGTPLYLDTEFMRERTYYPRLALVQVHDGETIRLIDTTRVEAPALLAALSERPLVMHACSEDLEALAAFTDRYPEQVEDTQIAAALVGQDMQVGYQRLVERLSGVTLPKGATRTDWLKRPLTREQLDYAEDDVKYLPEVTEKLRTELQRLERLDWWHEECTRLCADARRRAETDGAWRNVKGVGYLQGQELAVLIQLAEWRERTARDRDMPKTFLIRDSALLDLSREAPRSAAGLHKLGLHPRVIRQDADGILACIGEGLDSPPPMPLPAPLDLEQRKQVKVLREQVADIALSLNLKPDVLMRRRWLESLVRDPGHLPEPLTGWRRELVAEPLLEWV